jgi:hypothetical protein
MDSRSVGYAQNALLPLGAYSVFRGQAVDGTSVMITYTRTGDSNLDGLVNNDDVAVVAANYAPGALKPSGSAWAVGDFDYNGFVDNDDITLLGVFYTPTATALAPPPLPMPAPFLASLDESNDAGFVAAETGEADVARPTLNPSVIQDLMWGQPAVHRAFHPVASGATRDPDTRSRKYESLIALIAESIAADRAGRPIGLADSRLAVSRRPLAAPLW